MVAAVGSPPGARPYRRELDCMYVVLDTNLFTADKQFKNGFWRLIGTRPKRWGLHVAVPWPVVQEAIANR